MQIKYDKKYNRRFIPLLLKKIKSLNILYYFIGLLIFLYSNRKNNKSIPSYENNKINNEKTNKPGQIKKLENEEINSKSNQNKNPPKDLEQNKIDNASTIKTPNDSLKSDNKISFNSQNINIEKIKYTIQ